MVIILSSPIIDPGFCFPPLQIRWCTEMDLTNQVFTKRSWLTYWFFSITFYSQETTTQLQTYSFIPNPISLNVSCWQPKIISPFPFVLFHLLGPHGASLEILGEVEWDWALETGQLAVTGRAKILTTHLFKQDSSLEKINVDVGPPRNHKISHMKRKTKAEGGCSLLSAPARAGCPGPQALRMDRQFTALKGQCGRRARESFVWSHPENWGQQPS